MSLLGIVVIGRNEGERLRACLASLYGERPVVYVDSGSTDGSPATAVQLGADVIELSHDRPFTAARGRNAGLQRLLELHSNLQYVQFIDGDCEIQPRWFEAAINYLNSNVNVGVVCGRLQEKRLDTVYGRLCNMEWKGPLGKIVSSGGIAMMRVNALTQVGGFNESIAAGEEADLCIRLMSAGYSTFRLADDMGTHDAGMTRFSQWWRRAKRAGRSFAQGSLLHRGGEERKHVKAIRSILFWAIALPLLAIALAWFTHGLSLLCLAAYALLWWKIRRGRVHQGDSQEEAQLFATFCILAKFAQAIGAIEYALGLCMRTEPPRSLQADVRNSDAASSSIPLEPHA